MSNMCPSLPLLGVRPLTSCTNMLLLLHIPFRCMEFHFGGKVMDVLFSTLSRREANDLVGSEKTYKESNVDYLLVRPVGLAEDAVPAGEWFVQKEKHVDLVATNIAKMDCGRFMVEEALHPTRHRTAVVVGGDPEKDKELTEILEQRGAQES